MEKNTNYSDAFKSIASGIKDIASLLPETFNRNMRDIILNHYIFLLFVVSVICIQLYYNIDAKTERDAACKQSAQLEMKLDSAMAKNTKYTSYNYNPYK